MVISYILIALLIGFIVILLKASADAPTVHEKEMSFQEERNRFIASANISSNATEYVFKDFDYSRIPSYEIGKHICFFVDETHLKVFVFSNQEDHYSIPFSEIIGCEIIADSKVTGGVGRAIVGGVLAGEAGAIVGAVTAKEYIMSYKVALYRNSTDSPRIDIDLIDKKTATNDTDFSAAVQFANNISATVKAIVYRNEHK